MESVNTEEKRLVRYQQMLEARAYSPALAADSAPVQYAKSTGFVYFYLIFCY